MCYLVKLICLNFRAMDEGYFKLYRKILDSQIFAHQTGLKIWIWCLAKANHKKKSFPIKLGKGESIVTVSVGQFLFGRLKAEEELNIDGSAIYRWMKKLEEMEMISIESNSHYSVVTILNWEDYQQQIVKDEQPMNSQRTTIEQPMNSHCTTDEQPLNTTKNDKNYKNDKNKEIEFNFEFLENDSLKLPFMDWFNYKQSTEHKFTNQASIEASFKQLKTLSSKSVVKSIEIVTNSIAGQYKNLYLADSKHSEQDNLPLGAKLAAR